MSKFEDEIFYGLGRPQLSIQDVLHDDATSAKKFTRSHTTAYSPEMFQAMQELAAHRNLPFGGNVSALERHAVGNVLEQLEQFLDENTRTIFRAFMQQQRRLTRERFIVTIEDALEQQVDILRFWTAKGKWGEVVRTAQAFQEEVAEYPVAVWREHAASVWLRNAGLRDLLKVWGNTMKEDSPQDWQAIEQVYKRMERLAES